MHGGFLSPGTWLPRRLSSPSSGELSADDIPDLPAMQLLGSVSVTVGNADCRVTAETLVFACFRDAAPDLPSP